MRIRRITSWPRYDWRGPFDELERMRREIDRLFDYHRGGFSREPYSDVFPLLNVSQDSDNYYIRAELPGIKADELHLSVAAGSLTLSGERKIAPEGEQAKYHRREREAGKFNRIINLPGQVDTSNVEARATNGMLTIVLPKAAEAKPRQISVKTS